MEQENKVVNVAYSEPKDNTNSEFTIISYQNENSSGNKAGLRSTTMTTYLILNMIQPLMMTCNREH